MCTKNKNQCFPSEGSGSHWTHLLCVFQFDTLMEKLFDFLLRSIHKNWRDTEREGEEEELQRNTYVFITEL